MSPFPFGWQGDSFVSFYLSEIIYYFIELSKFEKEPNMLDNPLDKWIYFIKYASDLEEIPDIFKEDIFIHAFEKASIVNMPKDEFELYEKGGMAITDTKGAIELAREEGLEKGMEEGKEIGEKIGKEENRIETAKKLLSKNMDYEFIREITGLSLEVIEKLSSTNTSGTF